MRFVCLVLPALLVVGAAGTACEPDPAARVDGARALARACGHDSYEGLLAACEERDNLFPNVNWKHYL